MLRRDCAEVHARLNTHCSTMDKGKRSFAGSYMCSKVLYANSFVPFCAKLKTFDSKSDLITIMKLHDPWVCTIITI